MSRTTEDQTAYMRTYRARPGNRERQQTLGRLRYAALLELAKAYPAEFEVLFKAKRDQAEADGVLKAEKPCPCGYGMLRRQDDTGYWPKRCDGCKGDAR
jgi:hypothetical protein